jgi:hypothetical protein
MIYKFHRGDAEVRRKAKKFAADLRGLMQISRQDLVLQKRSPLFDLHSSAQICGCFVFSTPPRLSGEL